jgi:hypothetical protein
MPPYSSVVRPVNPLRAAPSSSDRSMACISAEVETRAMKLDAAVVAARGAAAGALQQSLAGTGPSDCKMLK